MEVDLAKQLRESLKAKELGLHIHFFDKIESTQDCALSMAQNGSPSGTVIIAEKNPPGEGEWERNGFLPKEVYGCQSYCNRDLHQERSPSFSS